MVSGVVFLCPMCKLSDDMVPPQWIVNFATAVAGPTGTTGCLGYFPITPSKGDLKRLSYRLSEKRAIFTRVPSVFGRNARLATAREIMVSGSCSCIDGLEGSLKHRKVAKHFWTPMWLKNVPSSWMMFVLFASPRVFWPHRTWRETSPVAFPSLTHHFWCNMARRTESRIQNCHRPCTMSPSPRTRRLNYMMVRTALSFLVTLDGASVAGKKRRTLFCSWFASLWFSLSKSMLCPTNRYVAFVAQRRTDRKYWLGNAGYNFLDFGACRMNSRLVEIVAR